MCQLLFAIIILWQFDEKNQIEDFVKFCTLAAQNQAVFQRRNSLSILALYFVVLVWFSWLNEIPKIAQKSEAIIHLLTFEISCRNEKLIKLRFEPSRSGAQQSSAHTRRRLSLTYSTTERLVNKQFCLEFFKSHLKTSELILILLSTKISSS